MGRFKIAAALLLVLTAAFLCSKYLFQLALIQGGSMSPTYHPLQLVVVNKRAETYGRGDVIIFRKAGIQGFLIKRIAACPGDTVVVADGVVFVDGEAVTTECPEDMAGGDKTILLDSGQYFVLGDNYRRSIDSRSDEIGLVAKEEIVGRVVFPQSGAAKITARDNT